MQQNNNESARKYVTSPGYILRSVLSSVLIVVGVLIKFVPDLLADADRALDGALGQNWLLIIGTGIVLAVWNVMGMMKAIRG